MAATSQFALRAAASWSLLASLRGTRAFAQVSWAECAHLKNLPQSSGPAPRGHIAALAEKIRGAGFLPKDEAELLETVAELAASTALPEQSRNGADQDYEAGVFLAPTAMRGQLAKTANAEDVFRLCGLLGLRKFSEGTMRVLGLAVLCATEGVDEILKMAPAVRANSIKPLKAAYRRFAKGLPEPPVRTDMLPISPEAPKAQCPDLFKAACPDGVGDIKFPAPPCIFRGLKLLAKMRVHSGGSRAVPETSDMSRSEQIVRAAGNEIRSALQNSRGEGGVGPNIFQPKLKPHVAKGKAERRREDTSAAKAKEKATGSGKAKGKAKAKAGSKAVSVSYCDEKSREHFLGRCSETPSAQFSYKGKSKKSAEKAAKAWCRDQCRKFKAPIQPKFLE
ncbi:unnamed protein product [Prorocentrum cordatum]|uniref:Uncharacterized protein n=1 Tax=Prorocentrum cordatum TaxID=2364126 RepID=A0ABN9PST0_9DINO|nr:unnamed protein product [Polarella glacialis]